MIKIDKVEIFGWEAAIRGMRNPMNSWNKSDSKFDYICEGDCNFCTNTEECNCIGENDLKLMKNLSKAGNDHGKYLRMINVTLDITAPLYWWKEFDTYKVGTVANSCSTMHKIQAKEFTLDDFSYEHLINEFLYEPELDGSDEYICLGSPLQQLKYTIRMLNVYRMEYLQTKEKTYWWQMIQLLPSSYNQLRTVQLNYAVLKNMYHSRKHHKLDEWREFCEWVKNDLPYADLIVGDE